jgi:hypothetical protein
MANNPAEDLLMAQWRSGKFPALTPEEALTQLRKVWAEYRRTYKAHHIASLQDRDIPFRSSRVPWFEYLCGSDVVRKILPDGEREEITCAQGER